MGIFDILRAGNFLRWLSRAAEGDPEAIAIVGGAVAILGVLVAVHFARHRRKMREPKVIPSGRVWAASRRVPTGDPRDFERNREYVLAVERARQARQASRRRWQRLRRFLKPWRR